jgi:hypothetical protein
MNLSKNLFFETEANLKLMTFSLSLPGDSEGITVMNHHAWPKN